MSSAEEPLIARGDVATDHLDAPYNDDDTTTYEDADSTTSPPPTLFVYLLILSAGISGLLFGYDTGVISSTLISLGTSLSPPTSPSELTPLDKSAITASTSLLALLTSPLASLFADRLGRRPILLAADALFIAGAFLQAAARSVPAMVAGRAVVGMGVGAASCVAPLYIAELAPARLRGRLVTANVLLVTLGQVVAYVVGWALREYAREETAWRWMVGLGAVPAVAQGVVMGVAMPETPRWLVMVGRVGEARGVVRRVLGPGAGKREVEGTVKGIEVEVREEREGRRLRGASAVGGEGVGGWRDALGELVGVRRNRRALAIACLLQGLQQLCGFNSLMYFSATIFTMLGFPIPTLTSLVVAVTNFAFTVAALFLIDRIGRRRILLLSLPFMVAGLLLAAYGFSYIDLASAGTAAAPPAQGAAVVVLVSVMVYVASYAMGLGNVPWMQSELFALNVRSLGSGIATATNWGANFVIGLTFLLLMDALTPSWTFALYAVICAAGYGLIWRFYPETAGLSLEEAASLLEDDRWGVS